MENSAQGAAVRTLPSPSPTATELAQALGVSPGMAERLLRSGFTSAAAVRGAASAALAEAGLTPEEIAKLRPTDPAGPNGPAGGPTADADRIVEQWATRVRRPERSRRRKLTVPAKESTDVLRRWVDGDDRAMEDWIRASEPSVPSPPPPLAPTTPVVAEGAPAEGSAAPRAVTPILEREETVVRWLTGLLDRVKSDQFDPSAMIQEVQDLHRQLYDEQAKRKQLEDEVEHVKRGSIAVIKYVRSREAKEREVAVRAKEDEIAELKLRLLALEGVAPAPGAPAAPAPSAGGGATVRTADAVEKATRELEQRLREEFTNRESDYVDRETELRRRVVQIEGELRTATGELDRTREREALAARPEGPVSGEVTRRLEEAAQREKDLDGRENELRRRFEDIRLSSEELERRRGPLEFKERELAAYDQQLQTRRQALDIEARRLEELRRETGATGVVPGDEGRRLDDLRHELSQKEAELRARETQLQARVQELERLAGQTAEAEAQRMHEQSVAATQEIKIKTGVRRLDDLLYGGYPVGAQVLVNGPAHTGKDVLARLFSVEGLRLGVPSVWVVTDKTVQQVRDDLTALYPGYADAEKKGMVRYVDLYSRSVGAAQSSANVRLLSSTDKAVLEQLAQTVNSFAEELKEKFPTYRLIFESVSTVTAYLDTAATFRFLQPFVGRRKLDGAVAYYELDSGMHSESDLETLEHMVDGSINLKVEQMKTFLAVRGIGEAQARAWIGYTFTKRSLNLGSFSLEHIR